jgi:hypothetical protein
MMDLQNFYNKEATNIAIILCIVAQDASSLRTEQATIGTGAIVVENANAPP